MWSSASVARSRKAWFSFFSSSTNALWACISGSGLGDGGEGEGGEGERGEGEGGEGDGGEGDEGGEVDEGDPGGEAAIDAMPSDSAASPVGTSSSGGTGNARSASAGAGNTSTGGAGNASKAPVPLFFALLRFGFCSQSFN